MLIDFARHGNSKDRPEEGVLGAFHALAPPDVSYI